MSDSIEGAPAGPPARLPTEPPHDDPRDPQGSQEPHSSQGPDPHAPAEPAPLGVPRTPTGDAGVDERLTRLADADHLPADGHVEVYEDVHRGLRDALTALDAPPGVRRESPVTSSAYDHRNDHRS
ncbi:hypothetical protein [Streptomyces sp. 150FB]|uniref:hypothetical protein n=1 Tax=Streptomyces sp. 150FB TaxID=1576605 RepID=UPI00099B79A3|nr:hypothetical protein [Streptomyces sp. 150FB]